MALPMISNDTHSPPPSSLRGVLKSCIGCFRTNLSDDGRRTINHPQSRTRVSLKSPAQDLEIRDRWMVLIRMRGKSRRRHGWADFSYDPESYSLNFEDENSREDELPLHNFMARLPATPGRFPVSRVTAPRREVVAWS